MLTRRYGITIFILLLNWIIAAVDCRYVLREFNDDMFINSIVPGAYRPYHHSKRFLSVLEPRRVIRQDYTPTPCRWKLCASLFRP
ncbi:hypothetical protein L596_003566 [Steinernema carpocapsae]|uniref:Uncharacterized protein n=1 Tax=Steinernema carpocapsae TaxID=34508 RepID=A0A4U8UT40_STECR|nr:hypothetical protein L596_003566 [Steinernema carpocapsae]